MIYFDSCFNIFPTIPDKSIDLFFADMPYDATECRWECNFDLKTMWTECLRFVKDNGVFAFTATQPFATDLINSKPTLFRYDLIWLKTMPTGFLNANLMPMRAHESVLIFYRKLPTFNPQYFYSTPYSRKSRAKGRANGDNIYDAHHGHRTISLDGRRNPLSYFTFPLDKEKYHPTQKPVKLLEWIIATYTNPGETVLDPCAGSGTTGVAARNLGRKFILCESDKEYYDIINKRLSQLVLEVI